MIAFLIVGEQTKNVFSRKKSHLFALHWLLLDVTENPQNILEI